MSTYRRQRPHTGLEDLVNFKPWLESRHGFAILLRISTHRFCKAQGRARIGKYLYTKKLADSADHLNFFKLEFMIINCR